MTDRRGPGGAGSGMGRVETLLREMTHEDGELLEVPDDLWSAIEAALDLACD